ncbi:RloB family protein [Corynebacterium coyleae]|uniref:RloB family protein n=1 Tax=Corynebacterium coyleae TaxID=53374 RepID=UPI003D71DDFC
MDCFRDKSVKVEVRQGDKPDPPALLRTADDWLAQLKRSKDLQPGDQAWVVLDEDAATPEQLGEVFRWAAERKDRGVAFSVPAFEVWLLLHYAEAKGVRSQKEVETALKAHWPTFTKTAKPKFTMEQIQCQMRVFGTGVPETRYCCVPGSWYRGRADGVGPVVCFIRPVLLGWWPCACRSLRCGFGGRC